MAGTNVPYAKQTAVKKGPMSPRSKIQARLARKSAARRKQQSTFNGLLNGVFEHNDNNAAVFNGAVKPCLDHVLAGGVGAVFSYGQTGSGKTHTILGYGEEYGLYAQAMMAIEQKLQALGDETAFVSISFTEMHKRSVYDLFDNRRESAVREGPNGDAVFRLKSLSKQEITGYSTHSVKQIPCRTVNEAVAAIAQGLECRQVGCSNVHSQSSRSHAFLEMSITNKEIAFWEDMEKQIKMEWDEFVENPQAPKRFTMVKGKRVVDLSQERNKIFSTWMTEKQLAFSPSGGQKGGYEWLAKMCRKRVSHLKATSDPCFSGKVVFVDLAGSEYGADKGNVEQTEEEYQESKLINMSLSALNEVIRAKNCNDTIFKRIPYRASILTHILRKYFRKENCQTVMIGNVSPSVIHTLKTIKTMRYCSMVADSRH